jgi:hypothetical protein
MQLMPGIALLINPKSIFQDGSELFQVCLNPGIFLNVNILCGVGLHFSA